jgi:hypothetical protein
MTSFELIATSHPCEVTFHDNHSIDWFFDNIMLPDSFTNEPESHGFIQFHIQTLPLSEPFILENEAAIYFDFNEPVITPPAVTSVVICAEAGAVCDDGDACTENDMIQTDCTCAGESNCSVSISINSNRICDGSDAIFSIQGPPNTQLNYILNQDTTEVILNSLGTSQIIFSNDGNTYMSGTDTLVVRIISLTSLDGLVSSFELTSDTVLYSHYKEPTLTLASSSFGNCYSDDNWPFIRHSVQANFNSTVYYSYNTYFPYTFSYAAAYQDFLFPDGEEYSLSNPPTISEEWLNPVEFQTNFIEDTTNYIVLGLNQLNYAPENFPLSMQLDSIRLGNCTVHLNSIESVVVTPSSMSLPFIIPSCLNTNVQPFYAPILLSCDSSILTQIAFYGMYPLEFLGPEIDQMEIDIPDYTYEFVINDELIIFELGSTQTIDTASVGNYYFEAEAIPGYTNDINISFAFIHDDYLINDTITIQLIAFSGLDGCRYDAEHPPSTCCLSQSESAFQRLYYIVNPIVPAGIDTLTISCENPILLEQAEISGDFPLAPCLFNCSIFGTYSWWFSNSSDPIGSTNTNILTVDDFGNAWIEQSGMYYNQVFDLNTGISFRKTYVVQIEPSETSCDDLDPCTLNDITQPDCTCVGTYTDTDADGVCDALDDCDSSLAGTVCDDGNDCTVNDVIQADCTCSGLFSDGDGDGVCDAQDPCNNSLAGGSCDDGDVCTINDIIQSDCSCLGTFADNDNDGICDAEDVCDNTLAGSACDDLNPCTINDLIQADCSCSGTFADNDSDGICDAEDTCDNTLAGSACDDLDPCTINDQIQTDCSCSGFFADSDSDGICDTAEIAGCTDSDACNYNANATDDDGSCSYVDSFAIVGNTNVTTGITEEYTYPGQASSSFVWVATPGTITNGQGTPVVSVVWDDAPNGTVQVTETNEINCVGEPVVLQVNITPNAITAFGSSSLSLYPNPANDLLFVSGNIPSSTKIALFNSIGQCVETGSFQTSIDVSRFAEGMYYLRLELDGTTIQKAFTIIHHP